MKPTLPQGTRDFNPDTLKKRYFIINKIKAFFQLYGFEPLETPAMENLETLTGKYGDEGDKLIFKILNNGLDHPDKRASATVAFENILSGTNDKNITSRALRYDLTIPFARFVATNYHALPIPFKRYQIQPVWRADRPQKGRYREFYQCDADVAGTYSLIADAELALLYRDVFQSLDIPVSIKLNNRKLLTGLAEITERPDAARSIITAIDKLDKIGKEEVKNELRGLSLPENTIDQIDRYLSVSGNNFEKIESLKTIFQKSENALQGLDELKTILTFIGDDPVFHLDTTLARGLDYYTGTIYEIKAEKVKIGSIGGGGRYDDLTGLFGVKGVPGVGISFGIDRIYDVMEELQLFPEELRESSTALFFNLGEQESAQAFAVMQQCRKEGIACELFYERAKLDKQFKYAEKRKIPYVIIIGSREMAEGICKIKNLESGKEESISLSNVSRFLKEK